MIRVFIGFLKKILKRRVVNDHYLRLYIDSRRDRDYSDTETVSLAFICGIVSLEKLQQMYPMFTRERIRLMLLKAERVGKKCYENQTKDCK
jgi:hypothetical protein